MFHIIMFIIFRIIRNLLTNRGIDTIAPLGRWKLDYSYRVINTKIDLANQDNCAKQYLSK
jgi:hypothetical protein